MSREIVLHIRAGLIGLAGGMLVACGGSSGGSSAVGQDVSESPNQMTAASGPGTLQVLSNRADLISGGDALVEVALPAGSDGAGMAIDIDGTDVTDQFALRLNGRFMGRLSGLQLGENQVSARLPDGSGSRITITNHPIGGPIFSGAQIQPWLCTTQDNGLETASDDKCNAETVIEFFYMPSAGTGFQPYDPDNPPGDVAMTTTDQGNTVPYIIRQETGTSNRGIHRVAVLFNPEAPFEPWDRQAGWNGKLFYPFGASCGTIHSQSAAQDVQLDRPLSRGFMVATSSLNVLGNNCNTVTSAESVMMLKEHIVETYGEIRYTMAQGCSGGAIGQQMISNNYPGLLQGIQPNCSYMDNWTTGLEVVDCHLLLEYYNNTSPALWANVAQRAAVNGHQTNSSCIAWEALFAPVVDPVGGCGLPAEQDYDPETNPTGCRGGVSDFNVSIIGTRPSALWGNSPEPTATAEAIAGGFARFPFGNVGVQYGLQALLDNEIITEQFVDLNENIGAVDVDFNFRDGRRQSDTGSEVLYRIGGVNDGNQMDRVAIIDLRGTSNNEIHTDYHSYAMRERMIESNGHADNQIIWTTPAPLVPPPAVAEQSFLLLDEWLAAIEADDRALPRAQKVVDNKPDDAVDACFINGEMVTDETACSNAFPFFASPRIVAGMALTHDKARCQLRPLNREDYADALPPMTDDQFARLQTVFPNGVCDYSQPGFGEEPSQPWMTFENGPGGEPLGTAPVASAINP